METTQQTQNLSFGEALDLLQHFEFYARRKGWNGKGMAIFYRAESLVPNTVKMQSIPDFVQRDFVEAKRSYRFTHHLMMIDAKGHLVPWLASQSDVLATDWEILTKWEPAAKD
jgi:hypothetical protein